MRAAVVGKTVNLVWNAVSGATHYIITQTGKAANTYRVAATSTSFTTPELADGDYNFTVAGSKIIDPAVTDVNKQTFYTGPASAPPVSVKTPATAAAPGTTIPILTDNDSSGPIELGSKFTTNRMIPAHGWAVLVRDVAGSKTYEPRPIGIQGETWIRSGNTSLPDLAHFFAVGNGGTISLHAPTHTHDHTDHGHVRTLFPSHSRASPL